MAAADSDRRGVLVIQPLPGIGDMIWHLPHLKSIAAASDDRRITLLTKARSGADTLLSGCDFIEDILWIERATGKGTKGRHDGPLGGWRLGSELRERRFRTAWILHGSSRYGLAAMRAGIPERIGFGLGFQDMFLTTPHALGPMDKPLKPIAKASRLLELNSVPMVEAWPNLPVAERAASAIKQAYGAYPRPWTVLPIGSSESFKQWGVARFAELISALLARSASASVSASGTFFLIGGPAEAEMASAIGDQVTEASGAEGRVVPVLGLPLDEVAALAAAADVSVGNDTGVLNIAGAVGTPSVGLFGGSPVHTEDPRIRVVKPEGIVRFGDERMGEITVPMVLDALDGIEVGGAAQQ